MDCSVANITTALKEKDMFDDTIVIFISDNGGKILQINKTKIRSNYFNLLLGDLLFKDNDIISSNDSR